MAPLSFLSLLSCLSLLCIAQAQDSGTQPRSHGLAQENPVALSPSAFQFFHPNSPLSSANVPCSASHCAPVSSFSSAATEVQAAQVHEVVKPASKANATGVGAGGVVGIVFGFVLIVLLAMGVYYVVVTRRANANRANSVQPDV